MKRARFTVFSRRGTHMGSRFSLQEEAGVAVAQEAEAVTEGVVVDGAPVVVAHKGRHEQQQCALGLVKIGDHAVDDAVLEAGGYHELCAARVALGMMPVEIVDDVAQRLLGRDHAGGVVGHPLRHGELILVGIGVRLEHLPYVVEALERAHPRPQRGPGH